MMIATKYEQLNSHFISLFEHNSDAILLLNTDGYILDANPAFIELGGYLKADCVNQHFSKFIVSDIDNNEDQNQLFYEIDFLDLRFTLITKANTHISCLMRLNPVKENETIVGYLLIIKNMMKLDKMAEHYLESELNYRMIAENFHDVLILMDKDKNYLYVSPSSEEVFDFDHMKLDNRDPFFNIHSDYVDELNEKFNATIEKGEAFKIKLKAYHEKRGWIWTEIKGKSIYNKSGKFLHVLLIARDISQEREQEEKLKYLAYHDVLTSLPNRRMFVEQLELTIKRVDEEKSPFAILLLDIDNFKQINDSYGHEIGDKVIVEFSSRISRVVGEYGLVARLGGDEFVILIKDFINEEQVINTARQINKLIKQNILIQHTQLEITTSIGISICNGETFTASQILRYADEALYNVKRLGKDTFSVYGAK